MRNIFKYSLSLYYTSRVFSATFFTNSNKNHNKKDCNSVQIFSIDETDAENPKLLPNWKAIDKIFRHNKNVQQKPLKLFVVCGKPRIGKSTFCSLLYNNNNSIDINVNQKSNEKNSLPDKSNDNKEKILGKIWKIFDTSSSSFKPNTKGVWITPIPIQVKNKVNGQLLFNAFIVDVEGILGPNSEKFIYQQLFVLSTIMSSHFVYYLRHPFDEYFYEILKKYSTLAETLNNKNQKLILLISNVKNQKEFKYGSEDSHKYMNTLDKDTALNLQKFNKNFESIECFLMPEPAHIMRTQQLMDEDQEYSVESVGEEYLQYLSQFRQEFIAPNEGLKTVKTGEDFADYLKDAFDPIINGSLEQIPDNFSLLSTDRNEKELKKIMNNYRKEMKPFFDRFVANEVEKEFLIKEHKMKLTECLNEFSSNPWSRWKGTDGRDFMKQLETELNQEFEEFNENSTHYKTCLTSYITRLIDFCKKYNYSEKMIDDLKSIHKEFTKLSKDYFLMNCNNKGLSCGYDFKALLDKNITNFYQTVEVNILHMCDKVKRHKDQLNKNYDAKPWHEKWFNWSNSYIHADNECFEDIYYELNKNISNINRKYGLNIENIFFDKTKDNFESKYNTARTTETVVGVAVPATTGTTTLVCTALLGLGPVGWVVGGTMLAGGAGYYAVRRAYTPDLKREEIKKK